MTTIAVSTEMMACDTRYDDDGLVGEVKTKIYRIKGDIVGYAGSVSQALLFIDWYKNQKKEKPDIGETSILILKADGTIEQWDSSFVPMKDNSHPFYAIGDGAQAALAAMYAGATPAEAVKIAIKINSCTGGRVKVLNRRAI